MSHAFDSRSGPVFVQAEISGPKGRFDAKLILDTGATGSALSIRALRFLGYEPSESRDLVQLTAGFGSAVVPRVMLNRFTALGHHAIGLRVLAHDLPPEAGVDGLLGLDFLRDHAITIDFRAGSISLR